MSFYRLIDGYSEEETQLWTGETFPSYSLIRGKEEGRFLLTPDRDVPVRIIAAAMASGAERVYRPNGEWVPIQEFEELAILNDESGSEPFYALPEFIWHLAHGLDQFAPQDGSQGQEEASEQMSPSSDIPFVHLHTHTEYSALDGLATVDEVLEVVKAQGHTAVGISDHGLCAGHPSFEEKCEEEGVKPIFGMEAYLVEDRFARGIGGDYQHITLWAMTSEGLDNLYSISTEGYRDGADAAGGKPFIDWDTLQRFNEGIIAGSGCLRGPLADPLKRGDHNQAILNSQKLTDIFGDRYYIEIHCAQIDVQFKVNEWLVKHAQEFNIPMVVAVDSHYAHKDQRDDHQVWVHMQTGKDVSQEIGLFGGEGNYHMLDANEILASLDYLGVDVALECMANSVTLADRCNAKIQKRQGMPRYSAGPDAEQKDIDKMFDIIMANWDERTANKPYTQEQAMARLKQETDIIVPKGFPGYFCMNSDLVSYAKENGVLVGPGRGSGAGSFVAYLMRIVEVDPLEHDLLFARFMTPGRTALPDFDIDYPSSKKQFMLEYATKRWGKIHVCAVGSEQRIKNKGAFRKTSAAIRSRLPEGHFQDIDEISKIIDRAEAGTAGLGLSWEDLFDAVGDELDPYKTKYPYLFEMAEKFKGRLATYGQHAAGLVLDPQYNLENTLPMRLSADGKTLVTQWDKDVLDKLGFVKFDFLNLRNLDTIQVAIDLVNEQTGERIDVNRWREEYREEKVFQNISQGWTLGMFQIETALGTRTVKQLKPTSLSDLSDCITLGRPGPMRSGLDKTYFRRREGKEKVTYAHPLLEKVLSKTYGTMIYQEDIMAVTIVLANYNDTEADYVRKILGKKKPEEAAKEGKKFIARAVENGIDQKVVETLWTQMEEFSRYSFNRAHAFAYAMLAYWTAWLKEHYPLQFMTACMSTIDQDEIPDYVAETRRLGFKVLPPDINDSKDRFVAANGAIRYGLNKIKGVGAVGTAEVIKGQPYASFDDFLERKGDCDMGQVKVLVHIGAFDSLESNRRALEARIAEEDLKPAERCIFYQLQPRNKYNNLPCAFDWDSEPPELGRTGKPLKKQKPPPARCSKACRHWTPRPLPKTDDVTPYTDEEIRQIEMEMLGIYLSSSPFDIIDMSDLQLLKTANELVSEPNGTYHSAILVTRVRNHTTKRGDRMQFVTADTPSGNMDITVFSDQLRRHRASLQPGRMALVAVNKNDKGITLQDLVPV